MVALAVTRGPSLWDVRANSQLCATHRLVALQGNAVPKLSH